MRIYLLLVVCLTGAAYAGPVPEDHELGDLVKALQAALTDHRQSSEGKREDVPDAAKAKLATTINVNDRGSVIAEHIEIDDVTRCGTLRVAAHGDRLEARIRRCFNEGRSLYCFPAKSRCFLLDVEDEGLPGLEALQEGIQQLQQFGEHIKDTIDVEGMAIGPNLRWAIAGKAQRSDLGEALANFEPEHPVFFVRRLREDAEILPRDEAGENRPVAGRPCSDGVEPRRMYAATNLAGNEYRVSCYERRQNNPEATCPRRRITYTFFQECMCCPGVTNRRDCLSCNDE